MPEHDPLPHKAERAARAWASYKRLMSLIAVAALAAAALSLVYLKSTGGPVPLDMMIATIAGIGLAVLLGTGLMGLIFLGNISGHDGQSDMAATGKEENDERNQA